MIKSKLAPALVLLFATAVAIAPLQVSAQNTGKPATEKKANQGKKPAVKPFNGKLKSVDKNAKTISVGKLTIQITSETKILKGDKPAMLEDGVVGENVSGAYQTADDGTLHATKVTFKAKEEKADKAKANDKEKEKQAK